MQVGLDLLGGVRQFTECGDVRDGILRRRCDLPDALVDEPGEGDLPRFQIGPQFAGAIHQPTGAAAFHATDDQVAFEAGGLDLGGSDHAADITTPAVLLGQLTDPGVEVGELGLGRGTQRGRLELHLVADPLQLGAQIPQPGGQLIGRRVEREPGPQLGRHRIGEPAGLRQ